MDERYQPRPLDQILEELKKDHDCNITFKELSNLLLDQQQRIETLEAWAKQVYPNR